MNTTTFFATARALGASALEKDELAEVEAAASRLGRQAVRFHARDYAVSFASGYGPNLEDDAVEIYELPPTRLVALGIVLALCRDASGFPFERRVSLKSFEEVAMQLVGERQGVILGSSESSLRHLKAGLADLAEMGYLLLTAEEIAVGTALASWSAGDWALVDEIRDDLGLPT